MRAWFRCLWIAKHLISLFAGVCFGDGSSHLSYSYVLLLIFVKGKIKMRFRIDCIVDSCDFIVNCDGFEKNLFFLI